MSGNTKINITTVSFPIDPKDPDGYALDPKEISVDVEGPERVTASIEETGRNGVIVSFKTSTSGEYNVNLRRHGAHIKFSPLTVNVAPKLEPTETAPVPSLPEVDTNKVRVEVDAVDESGDDIPHDAHLQVECEGPEHVTPRLERRGGHSILITFETFLRRGTFSVGILYKGKHIQRSPFDITLAPSDSAEHREFDVVKIAPLPVSREIRFTVDGLSTDGSRVDAADCVAKIVKGEDAEVAVKVTNGAPGKLLVCFDARQAGKHTLTIHAHGKEIDNSPFRIDVPAEAFGKQRG